MTDETTADFPVRSAAKGLKLKSLHESILTKWVRKMPVGRLRVQFPSGTSCFTANPDVSLNADLKIHDKRFVSRVLLSGDIGLAESYMAGEWETTDLKAVLKLGLKNYTALQGTLSQSVFSRLAAKAVHAVRANTKKGSRRNIAAHYDLGNGFYKTWLDSTMSYSSGLYEHGTESAIEAQLKKYHRLAEKLDLRPGERVLEIGCGWGAFAEIAARDYGCSVVCLTLSKEQAAFAKARMKSIGLEHRVEIRLSDYRDVQESFDKVASIEMFEAVGEKYWPTYFDQITSLLKPGGKAGLQIITISDEHFPAYSTTPDFIQLYVFPGGMLPCPTRLEEEFQRASLVVEDQFYFGSSYARTLDHWDAEFRKNWHHIKKLGFDERFFKLWRYYLCYCSAGFEEGRIDVGQFVLSRP